MLKRRKRNGRGVDAEAIQEDVAGAFDRLSEEFNERLDEARQNVVAQMQEVASRIREETAGQDIDEESRERLDDVLGRLDDMASYLDSRTAEDIEGDVTEAAREHVWRNLFIAFVVGLVAGIMLSRKD